MDPRNTVAMITGAGSGIGREIALRLAARGMAIAALDRRGDAAAATAAAIERGGGRALVLEADVSDSAAVAEAARLAGTALGPPTVLVNSAGIAAFDPLPAMTDLAFDRMIAVHLRGTFLTCRALLPGMAAIGWGRVVNISSTAALNGGGPGLAHYAAAKAGVIGLTKALALEYGPAGVTVNAIAPGLVDTPLIRAAGAPDDLYAEAVRRLPVRRIGQPGDIAAACDYLVSPEGGFCTGQVLSPNGGAA